MSYGKKCVVRVLGRRFIKEKRESEPPESSGFLWKKHMVRIAEGL
jgi:hypothetical protein